MQNCSLVARLMTPLSASAHELQSLPQSVNWLEVRGDLAVEVDSFFVRSHFPGRILYSCGADRSGLAGSCDERRNRLLRAAERYDLIELDGERDLDLLSGIPAEKRLIAWNGSVSCMKELREQLGKITSIPAVLYRLNPIARTTGDGLLALELLRSINRRDVIAYSTGPAGFWTRLLAPHYGAPLVFGATGDRTNGSGEPTIAQLIRDYGLPSLTPPRALFGIVGNPVSHSLSPRLHNAAYKALGVEGLFVPFQEESFEGFFSEMIAGGRVESFGATIEGLTIASPHKEAALKAAASSSEMVKRAGSTNVFIKNTLGWRADTTDPQGAVASLKRRGISVARQRVAVVGCGGAGRAVAAALRGLGAQVTLVNRSLGRGLMAQRSLGLRFIPLSKFSADSYSVLVNATPVGRNGEELPFEIARMRTVGTIIDLAYGSEPTPLVSRALSLGLRAADGLEVLLNQVLEQFRLMTGLRMPVDLARETLGCHARELAAVV